MAFWARFSESQAKLPDSQIVIDHTSAALCWLTLIQMFRRASLLTVRSAMQSHRFLSAQAGGKIGVIGLGNMGLSMAKNLLNNEATGKKQGVVVFDINSDAVKTMEALGAKVSGLVLA